MVFTALALAIAVTADPPATSPKPAVDSFRPAPAWRELGPSLWFDPKGKRLVIRARVALREGPLEHLLCLKGTKEHEAVLATPAVPRLIHAGLLLTGAEKGHPVQFVPKFQPPTGEPIAIELEWEADGKTQRVDARQWVRDERTKAALATDWVFAGSEFLADPVNKKEVYAAEDGDLVTVANFASSIMDLPFASTASDVDRAFVANTPQIPPQGTPVKMYLLPRPVDRKKGEKGTREAAPKGAVPKS